MVDLSALEECSVLQIDADVNDLIVFAELYPRALSALIFSALNLI